MCHTSILKHVRVRLLTGHEVPSMESLTTRFFQFEHFKVGMFKNLRNLLSWFPHVKEEEKMVEDDVVVEDVFNAHTVR